MRFARFGSIFRKETANIAVIYNDIPKFSQIYSTAAGVSLRREVHPRAANSPHIVCM